MTPLSTHTRAFASTKEDEMLKLHAWNQHKDRQGWIMCLLCACASPMGKAGQGRHGLRCAIFYATRMYVQSDLTPHPSGI